MKFKSLVLLTFLLTKTQSLKLVNEEVTLYLNQNKDSVAISLNLENEVKISGHIGLGRDVNLPTSCDNESNCTIVDEDTILSIKAIDSGFAISWQSNTTETAFQDCLDLNVTDTNWFGGSEKLEQNWPIENVVYKNRIYTTLKTDNAASAERYWLNSKGGYVFVNDEVPLFVDQNNRKSGQICFTAIVTGPYLGREQVKLEHNLVAKPDPKEGHLHAVNNFLGKPKSRPDDWIIKNPIWTTWAKYKKNISDDIVVNFAEDISKHGFKGQIEIDDYWETCYGSLTFNNQQFPYINTTVQTLKRLGFTVSLWTHPFVNQDCNDSATYGQEKGYFIKSRIDESDETSWWDGTTAHHIDFTKEEARKWFVDRLKLLQELHGIDSFKFDAGESDYPPKDPILSENEEQSPNSLTSAYVRTAAEFGHLIEVRSAWRTQDLGILVRMLDKDSRWSLNNGLHALITSLLQLNLAGYVFVLPDMIGGNGYTEKPTAELISRWIQANTFMPAMQFSYLPWEFTSENINGEAIAKKFVTLHESYFDYFVTAMNNSIENGTPVNPPIWWVDPTNADALKVNDEYLLGEDILVAPVIEEGANSRDIVLPKGSWKDGNNGTIYEGPQILKNYSAPIDVLPFFIKQQEPEVYILE